MGLTNILMSFSGLLLLPILTKNLTLHDFGSLGLFLTTMGMFSLFGMLALTGATSRFLPAGAPSDRRETLTSILALVLGTSILISLGILLIRGPLGTFLGNPSLIPYLAAIVPLGCVNQILLSYFIGTIQMRKYSLFLLLQTFGELGLIALFIKDGVTGVTTAYLITRGTITVLLALLVFKGLKVRLPKFSHTKRDLSYALPLIPGRLTTWAIQQSDRYFIRYFLSAAHVGLYTPGYGLGEMIYRFAAPIEAVLSPTLARLYDTNKIEEVKGYLKYSLKAFLLFGIPAVFGVVVLSKTILGSLTTEEITAGSYIITPYTAASSLLLGVSMVPVQVLKLTLRTGIAGVGWIIAAVLNTVLNLYFIPHFGIVGAAMTTLIAFSVVLVFTLYYSSQNLKFQIDFVFIGKSVLASLAMYFSILALDPRGSLQIILCIALGILIYSVVLFFLKSFNQEEKDLIRSLFRRTPTNFK